MNCAVGGQSSDGRDWVGGLLSCAGFRGRSDECSAELVCGDDAVVEYGDYVCLGEDAQDGCVVVLAGGRLDDRDAQMLVALGDASASGEGAGFCIAGDGGVAVEDEEAVGNEAGGVNLGLDKRRG